MNWYAIYTHSRSEKKVAGLLEDRGFTTYCPLVKVLSVWSDRKKWVYKPLLTSYIFVRISESLQSEIRKIPGVVNFVYWLGKPAIIREEEIERLKSFIQAFPNAEMRDNSPFEIGSEVQFLYGPLKGIDGVVVDKSKSKAKIRIKNIGLEIMAHVNLDGIKLNYAEK